MSNSKPGRPRHFGHRTPNGQLQRPTTLDERARLAARNQQANEAKLDPSVCPDPVEAKSVALAQPHRAGLPDKEACRLATALGRFVTAQGLPEPLYRGGRDYAALVRRWRAGKGIPGAYTEPREIDGDERSVEEIARQLDQLVERIMRIERALRRRDPVWPHGRVLIATNLLVLDELQEGIDLPPRMHGFAIAGLEFLAEEFEHVEKSIHPFGGSVSV